MNIAFVDVTCFCLNRVVKIILHTLTSDGSKISPRDEWTGNYFEKLKSLFL
jgi:hypothetical protein